MSDRVEARFLHDIPGTGTRWAWLALPGLGGTAARLVHRHIQPRGTRALVAERIAVVGSGPLADQFRSRASRDRSIRLVGSFDPASDLATLIQLAQHRRVDCAVLAMPGGDGAHLHATSRRLAALGIELLHWQPPVAEAVGPTRHVAGSPALVLAPRPIGRLGSATKTGLDCVAATVGLLLLAPLFLFIAAAIRLDSPGPAVFVQRRHGRSLRPFAIYKFRTMQSDGSGHDGRRQTTQRDCRVTRVGNLLRRTSLDELPQLWNVLNGTMSLVGPRPHPVEMRTEGLLGEEVTADYPRRYRVKPGMTGLAQINGHRGATATTEQLRDRLADDLRYIEGWSPWLDTKVLLLTPIRLVRHRGKAF